MGQRDQDGAGRDGFDGLARELEFGVIFANGIDGVALEGGSELGGGGGGLLSEGGPKVGAEVTTRNELLFEAFVVGEGKIPAAGDQKLGNIGDLLE